MTKYTLSTCCFTGFRITCPGRMTCLLWTLGPRFTKGRKSYDFRLILRPLTDQVWDRFTKLVGMVFYDFRFTTCGCEVFLVRRYENLSIS